MRKEKLTVGLLREMKDSGKERIADTEVQGLQVWVGKKEVSFYCVKKCAGKQYNFCLGHWPHMTLSEARTECLQKLGALSNHQDIKAPTVRKSPLIGEAIDYYLSCFTDGSKSRTVNEGYLKKFADFRGRKIEEVSTREIKRIHSQLSGTPVMANHAVKTLATAIDRLAKRMNMALENPARGIQLYPEKPRLRILSEKEAPLVMTALHALRTSYRHKVQANALLMMIYTGARKSNVLSMRMEEIVNGVWIVPSEKVKARRDIIVPLNAEAMKIALAMGKNAKDGYLFHTGRDGECGHLQNVRKTWETACRMAGVEDCHIHDLRRTLGSWMLMTGTPIEVVSKTLGHSSIRVTEQVYAHLLPHKISDATETAIRAMQRGKAEIT